MHKRKEIKAIQITWWRWVELNYRSIGYEPIALTAEPHRHEYLVIILNKINNVKVFLEIFRKPHPLFFVQKTPSFFEGALILL